MFGRKSGPNFGSPFDPARAPPPPGAKREPPPLLGRRVGRIAGATLAAGAFLLGTYTVFEVQRVRNLPPPGPDATDLARQRDHSGVFNAIARDYDGDVDGTELWSLMRLMRRRLVSQAKGDVLEVAAGTARNFRYYRPKDIKSITLTDTSQGMLDVAKEKWRAHVRSDPGTLRALPAYFYAVDAHRLPAPDATFDTVVSTFGVCSCSDPVKELRELGRVCKPDGRILLLEHGRSSHEWLNELLDKRAKAHAERWGCWWNRDVEKILEESGLEVEYAKRWHLGTTYYIIARPSSSAKDATAPAAS
ncbi:S-adenosyl-L-methionine-dependent methyltransferase [Hyaloraphidium curvatum]|nr:S-adenosyl-L-methionine-dependent methyltransferase [Hyaloraphidium curvatum]